MITIRYDTPGQCSKIILDGLDITGIVRSYSVYHDSYNELPTVSLELLVTDGLEVLMDDTGLAVEAVDVRREAEGLDMDRIQAAGTNAERLIEALAQREGRSDG